MANTDQTPEARSAQGLGAYVLGAVLPAVIINPAASKSDLLYWARAELGSLGQWLESLGTERAGMQLSGEELGFSKTDDENETALEAEIERLAKAAQNHGVATKVTK